MKTSELFELRKNVPRPVTHQERVYVAPTHKGAKEEVDHLRRPTGKWYVWRKVPVKNPDGTIKMRKTFHDVGFRELKAKKNAGIGHILGTLGDWLDEMGATKADIAEARRRVLASPEYEKLIRGGFADVSEPGESKEGTIAFDLILPVTYRDGTVHDERVRRKVHVNGTIRTYSGKRADRELDLYHAGRGATYHPMTVKTHPNLTGVERIEGTMRASLRRLADLFRKKRLVAAFNKLQQAAKE